MALPCEEAYELKGSKLQEVLDGVLSDFVHIAGNK